MAELQIQPFGRTARIPRRPQHTASVELRPWQIVPFLLAPVLPGETMKNLLFQARVVTDPIKNPLIGWWLEAFFWYVKHRDINEPERTTATNMMIDPTVVMPVTAGVDLAFNNYNGSAMWAQYCYNRCVATYFRDEGEPLTDGQIASFYAAQISQRTALDSALLESDYLAGTADNLVVGADDTVTGEEISKSWLLWQTYRASNITNLTYEEYLATYGIPIPAGQAGSRRPELIRYIKEWSYPVNTVDPATGTPSSAVSWALAERADKDRFFREPGFIFGCMLVRPKVYLSGQKGAVSGALIDALSWLPAVLGDNPEYSVRKFAGSTGPFATVTADYRVDLKDLFLYGDQWVNTAMTPGVPNAVGLPNPTMGKKYPTASDADAMFKSATVNKVRVDGVVSLNILGMQTDTTPTQGDGF